jgi:ribosome recycling factor
MNALNADASPVNAQKILLATLLQATELLEQSVVVSQFPEPANESRKVLVRVYAQLAKILKRNSVDAISKDTSIALEKLFKAQAINPYVAGRGANPQAWVTEEVIPKLDDDMKKAAFNINVYLHSFKRFYMMISDWRSRDKQGLESFFTSK